MVHINHAGENAGAGPPSHGQHPSSARVSPDGAEEELSESMNNI